MNEELKEHDETRVSGGVFGEIRVRIGKDTEVLEDKEIDDTLVSDSQPNKFHDDLPNRPTYASMASNNVMLNRNLYFEPTLTEGDNEFVIFDEELVNHGSLKWKFTICGHFVGMRMSYNELKYKLVRMWSKIWSN
ncbi:hypothetical protein Tco_1504825 [Tanacetum coccineum]